MNIKKIAATMAMTLLVSSTAIASASEAPNNATAISPLRTFTMHRFVEGDHHFFSADDGSEVTISIAPSDFRALAEKLGLDISDLSDEEIEATVQEHLQARHEALMALPFEERELKLLQEAAEEAGIDHSGMDKDELRTALAEEGISIAFFEGDHGLVTQSLNLGPAFATFDMSTLAAEYDLDTTGMTEEEVRAAVETKMEEERQVIQDMTDQERQAYFLAKAAKRAGIDTTGMSEEEIQTALEEKGVRTSTAIISLAELDSEFFSDMAAEYDIDTTGMTEEEIMAAVEAKMEEERAHTSTLSPEEYARYMLEKMAKRQGIDAANMSDEEIQSALAEQGIHFFFANEGVDSIDGKHAYDITIVSGEGLSFSKAIRTLPAMPLLSE